MSANYRRERYSRHTTSFTDSLIKVTLLAVFTIILGGSAAIQWKKASSLSASLDDKNILLLKAEDELSILRTLNPYHVGSNEVLAQAVNKADLFPGWITRVYPLPSSVEQAAFSNDVGSFVMNETRFSLSSHKSYGIAQPSKSMYRLNGLFPNRIKGRLQVGVEFYIKNQQTSAKSDAMSKISSCYARIDMNNKRVIDKKIHLMARFEAEQVLTGSLELNKGLFPISAMLYCDRKSALNGSDIEVSISFRTPQQHNLTTSRYDIFHIYNPKNIIAQL
ncbi:hypothetical protein [Cognaticolwellia mytili]|uniref:hypothetical protein n=1 Tax=Cognaticolwellia mytili TaxID=1888913 RepID=UPI000A175EEA|nr:hypothetical protein [Cognaticolwellia mytili]